MLLGAIHLYCKINDPGNVFLSTQKNLPYCSILVAGKHFLPFCGEYLLRKMWQMVNVYIKDKDSWIRFFPTFSYMFIKHLSCKAILRDCVTMSWRSNTKYKFSSCEIYAQLILFGPVWHLKRLDIAVLILKFVLKISESCFR